MLPKSSIDRIIPILKKSARRALRMQVRGFPKPYYCSFVLRDINWFNTWAGSGSMYRNRADHTRNVYCDIRVGSYRNDQVTDGGLNDNDEELDSVGHVTMPIDDTNYEGMKLALWRLTEAKFKEALADYNQKESQRISMIDPNSDFASFVKVPAVRSIKYVQPEKVDEEKWVKFCKRASEWMSGLPHVTSSWVEYDSTQETRILVSTEGSVIVQHSQVFSLSASFRKLTKEGSHIEQEMVFNVGRQKELPDMRAFKKQALQKHEQLLKLMNARKIHAFSGPVLLCPGPSGLLFHEAIGHRLEGSRLLSSGEGQTFKGQEGKPVLNLELTIRDNPKLKEFKGQRCIGAYDFDDEGSAAQDALLVENGVLRDFLNTRAATRKKNFAPNGHARNKKFQRPISRMAVTIIEGKKALNMQQLRELLIAEIKRQKKPFGMIVYETAGGETETNSYDFQAFSGEISYATLIYPDGKEIVVRGVNFVGTPLQALNNIIAIGDQQSIDNGYCGAESGFLPVTTISPAVLLRNLELQAQEEELVTQYLLPSPR
ncbi:MAG: TldD/PmbA family protein [Oligoflexia bacterium]|nr:TldD/PmbA family protein [Oligoflexia bacterium]